MRRGLPFFKQAKHVIKDTIHRFTAADPIVYSAAIAFFTIFSMPSILYIIVRVTSAFMDSTAVRSELYKQVEEKVGEGSAEQVQMILKEGRELGENPLMNVLSILLLLFTATVVFNFIKKALNSIWSVKPKPKKGVLKFAIDRFLSIGLILILGAVMLANLLADSIITIFEDEFANELLGLTPFLVKAANFLVSFGLATVIFALLFKFMPDIKSPWKPIWIGALMTAGLFTLGKFLIGRIISSTGITTTYGAAGSLAALLLWVFYSSVIVLLGAIFTKIYYLHKGYEVQPSSNAIAIEVREIERDNPH